jgi:hypothetical protein
MKDNQKADLDNLEREFQIERDILLKDMVSYSPRADLPIHRWFRYREGYSVDLINKLVEGKEKRILDPFCGCGTTILSAKINQIPGIGIDVNPISVFVSRVKTRDYEPQDIGRVKAELRNILLKKPNRERYLVPSLRIIDKAFHPEVLNQLVFIKNCINKIEEEKVHDFMLLGFISIIEEVSNTYKEGNGIKYKFTKRTKDGYKQIPLDVWYRENLPQDKIEYVNAAFSKKIASMISDLKESPLPKSVVSVFEGDARKINNYVENDSISLTAFSPPYCNCFDYFEIFKLELWLGEFIRDYNDLRERRKKALRSNMNSDLAQNVERFPYLEEFLNKLDEKTLWDRKIVDVIKGYFSDMKEVEKGVYHALEDGGRCIIIVGNSAYGGVLIPTDLLLARIAKEIGFKVEKIKIARHLTTSSQQKKKLDDVKEFLRESLVCLRK